MVKIRATDKGVVRHSSAKGSGYVITRSGKALLTSPAKSPKTSVKSWSRAFKK
jgi:hypothetical protein